jgi:23S rRNA (uracil1939-C5)-methyltransferase
MRTHRRSPSVVDRQSVSAVMDVTAIAAGGDGVSRHEGLVVFTPRTAPGDRAQIEFVPGPRFARGSLRSLETPSPDRVEPACAHYTRDKCGGCQIQHLSYDAQRAVKARIVSDSLQRIGHREVPPPEVRPSPSPWRYRDKLTLAMRRRGAQWYAGLHPYDAPGRVFAVADCPITEERILTVWRDVLAHGADLPDALELRGAVRIEGDAASFTLEGGLSWPASEKFFARMPSIASLWWTPEGGVRRRIGHRGADAAPGASFAQVNAALAPALQRHALERAMAHRPATLVDAYAGLGDTAAGAAEAGVRVTAIELDEDAAAWCMKRLPPGSRVVAARVEDMLEGALPADVVVLNPPRAGVDAAVTTLLETGAAATRAVIYVSCDPATLARDLARMPRWRIASLVCFDMFPQTAHVETVCELVPEAA